MLPLFFRGAASWSSSQSIGLKKTFIFQVHLPGEEQLELVWQHVPILVALSLHYRPCHCSQPVRLHLPHVDRARLCSPLACNDVMVSLPKNSSLPNQMRRNTLLSCPGNNLDVNSFFVPKSAQNAKKQCLRCQISVSTPKMVFNFYEMDPCTTVRIRNLILQFQNHSKTRLFEGWYKILGGRAV